MPERVATFRTWSAGHGVVRHVRETQARVRALERRFPTTGDGVPFWALLSAADRLASAGMWLAVHDTYARSVYLDGRPLATGDFKPEPEGHTGSALNIVPAYVGYLLANALSGHTRAWVAEQGHAVSGIDGVNVLVGNVTPAHQRYELSDAGLTRFVRDFYNYRLGPGGAPESPRGSHVNAHTAGGVLEGGYLGFAGLQYVHMPLPGERLVAFLSDGAFEEQRGPDWAPRYWRREDCGLVAPILICNGRRIDQRTTSSQQGGAAWLRRHLELNGFEPIGFDGRDPAAFAWAILTMERRLENGRGGRAVPRLPYGLAQTVKGYGFPAAGTNAAHNLPLGSDVDETLVSRFNPAARKLWVEPAELFEAARLFARHRGRPRERDHALARRDVRLARLPTPAFQEPGADASPMRALDETFVSICLANPHLRPRVGNPDEMRSNRLERTLEVFKHRVTDPEPGLPEALDGKVITALNEEAVVCAALANKGGISLVASYEAFGTKMYGALRQEIVFADHCRRAGRPQGWLSIPVVLTSHTYENGKNEQSHQDPGLCEALLGESEHVSRVLFPPDSNSAAASLEALYATRGQVWTLVVPKRELPVRLGAEAARRLVRDAAITLRSSPRPRLVLAALGAYQLGQVLRSSDRLRERGVEHSVQCVFEPRRLAEPEQADEASLWVGPEAVERLFPAAVRARILVTHTRAGRILALLRNLDTGAQTRALGYRNRGGTHDVNGMLFVNQQSWAHVLLEAERVLELPTDTLLEAEERAVLEGRRSPEGVLWPAPGEG